MDDVYDMEKSNACWVMWNWMANYCYMNWVLNYYYLGCMNCYTVVPDEISTSLYVNNLSILFILLYFVIIWNVAAYRMIICCKLQIEKGLWINCNMLESEEFPGWAFEIEMIRMIYCEVTCVVLSACYYVYWIIGRMCSTKCRLLRVSDG